VFTQTCEVPIRDERLVINIINGVAVALAIIFAMTRVVLRGRSKAGFGWDDFFLILATVGVESP